ncbi:MAG: prepilin-type N-terminal cleavage/methylation domain-containing protein [Lentisphaerae bacterium]|nr:prepilin-type N-terminal cleavage/methylation domain-containing protein [Lentisphaerota bacterium]
MAVICKNRNGFTLIELLIVILIIGILFGLLTISIRFARENVKFARQKSDRQTIAAAIQAYRHEYGRWPCDEEAVYPVFAPTNNYEIIEYLQSYDQGKNEREVTFMNFDEYNRDGAGNLCNPWKAPYKITIDLSKDTVEVE